MTTEWIIERLDAYPEHQGETDVVCTVYWRANATEELDGKSFFATAYSTLGVMPNSVQRFFIFIFLNPITVGTQNLILFFSERVSDNF